ncbi:MAG: site-specific integrase [Methanomassiliicoccaceae archaeon]|nr:site-specific integrase [Methanomassiliicoccaceae archaeon]
MAKDFEALRKADKVTTMDPAQLTAEDVKEYFLMLKGRGLSAKGLSHNISALKVLCFYHGNAAVDVCRAKYPIIKTRLPTHRLPTTPLTILSEILDKGNECQSYERIRNYSVVVCAYCAGMRPVEIQHARIENLNTSDGVIYIDVVKGQGSYGEPRYIPIHPEGIEILKKYVHLRNIKFGSKGYLFTSAGRRYFSTNALRFFKTRVENEVSHKFDFREGRRTFGQMLIDEGVSVEDVAVIMGHRTSRTTEKYYARRTQKSAMSNILKLWEKRRNEKNE